MIDLALAVALITSPQVPNLGTCSCSPSALRAIAVALEIADAREAKYLFGAASDYATDLRLLRSRWEELAYAPPASDANRWPERELINDVITANRDYLRFLEDWLGLDPSARTELGEAIHETEQLYRVWDILRDARCDYYYIVVRRRALKDLRDSIGPAMYYAGVMPPHVPAWRFARMP